MATSSLVINSTDSFGKSCAKTVTNVNPEVNSDVAKTFAQMLNALSNHTYVQTNRVDKANVDTEDTGGSGTDTRTEPTLSLDKSTLANTQMQQYPKTIKITYSGDGQLYVKSAPQEVLAGIWTSSNSTNLYVKAVVESATPLGEVVVAATATDNFKPAETKLTITN